MPSPTSRSRSDDQRRYWSAAGSPVAPSSMRPGLAANVSQIDDPRPSAVVDPSTWNAEVATPHVKPAGNVGGDPLGAGGLGAGDRAGAHAARTPARAAA